MNEIEAAVDLDMRKVPLLKRLETILRAWDGLTPGERLRIVNDKRPEPLQIMFRVREKGRHEWRYEQEGPTEWVATITKLRSGAGRTQ